MKFVRYLSKFLGSVLLLLLVITAVTFAVSNRTIVSISLWPLPVETTVQLGAAVLIALGLGLVVGSAIMSMSRLKTHRRARSSERRAASLEKVVHNAKTTLPPASSTQPKPGSRRIFSS